MTEHKDAIPAAGPLPAGQEVPEMVPSAEERAQDAFNFYREPDAPDILDALRTEINRAFRDGYIAAANGRAERMLEALREPSDELIEIIARQLYVVIHRGHASEQAVAALIDRSWPSMSNEARAAIHAVHDMLARVR